MSQTRRQTEPLRNKISSSWGNVPSVTCGMMLLDPMSYKSNLCMKQHQLGSDLKVAQRFFFGMVVVFLHSQIGAVVCSLWLRNVTALSAMHVGGRREPTPLPGEAHSTPREQEWISCPTVPCTCHGVKTLCSSARPLVTSLHRQPLINFHRVSISLWVVMSNFCSVDYFTSSSGRRSLSSSPLCRCSAVM